MGGVYHFTLGDQRKYIQTKAGQFERGTTTGIMSINFNKKNIRPKIKRRLCSGQTVEFSAQDEKMLRAAYDYMQGFAKRAILENQVSLASQAVIEAESILPVHIVEQAIPVVEKRSISVVKTPSLKDYRTDLRSEEEVQVEHLSKLRSQLHLLEEKLVEFLREDQRISLHDMDALMRSLGVEPKKVVLEHMMYEVDEMVDEMVSWDEFLLLYYRNVTDVSGNEPAFFFQVLEFILFDPAHKGRIVEDDVMEVLFARIGAAKLELELQKIFGNHRRAKGGDGTLTLDEYLAACVEKSGRRALVF